MARIRTVKPDFWRDDDLSSVSAEAALLAIGLLNISDDEGYFKANPKLVDADIFPLRELSSTVPGLLLELEGIGYINMFIGSDGKKYGFVTGFSKHQVISKAKTSDIKRLCTESTGVCRDSGTTTGQFLPGKEGKGRERKGNGRGREEEEMEKNTAQKSQNKKTVFKKPTQAQAIEFSTEHNLDLSGFHDYYESNGWMVGKNKMKDWKAAARGWHSRQGGFKNNRTPQQTKTPPKYIPPEQRKLGGNIIDSTARKL